MVTQQEVTNNKKKRIIIYFLFLIEFFVFVILVSKIGNTNEHASSNDIINTKDFQTVMENRNYKIEKLDSKNNYFKDYLVAKNNDSSITLTYVSVKSTYEENTFYNAKNQIIKNKSTGFSSTVSADFKNYNYYSISNGSSYHVLARKGNKLISGEGISTSKDEIDSIITELKFDFSISSSLIVYSILLASLIILLNQIVLWKIFKKAGLKPWKSLIPFYNFYCLFQLTFNSGWYFLLMFVMPIVNLITIGVLSYKLARAFGKNKIFSICSIPFFFITSQIIAFDNSTYIGNYHENKEI